MDIQLLPDFLSRSAVISYCLMVGGGVAVFSLVFVLLRKMIFIPLLKLLKLRRNAIEGAKENIIGKKEELEVLRQELDWRIEGARQLAQEKLAVTKMIGERRAEMILLDVRRETNRDFKNVANRGKQVAETVLSAIDKDITVFANDIKEKILGA